MKERPILFNAPMVRAILAGTKTQTRRIVKPQPSQELLDEYAQIRRERGAQKSDAEMLSECLLCPYGAPGDRLWVRENGWERPPRDAKMLREGADTWVRYYYDADGLGDQDRADFKAWGFKRRPSIHMPRWASRITLEITNVRVERLQDISIADAMAEGVVESNARLRGLEPCMEWRYAYEDLWRTINGPGSWESNPWVWVLEFRRV